MRLATICSDGYELEDGEERHSEAPDTCDLPPRPLRSSLQPGQLVKLIFRIELEDANQVRTQEVERMWVVVQTPLQSGRYTGLLDNDPYCTAGIKSGMEVVFEPRHVIQIYDATA